MSPIPLIREKKLFFYYFNNFNILNNGDYFIATIVGIDGDDVMGKVVVFAPSSGNVVEYTGAIENLEQDLDASNCPCQKASLIFSDKICKIKL